MLLKTAGTQKLSALPPSSANSARFGRTVQPYLQLRTATSWIEVRLRKTFVICRMTLPPVYGVSRTLQKSCLGTAWRLGTDDAKPGHEYRLQSATFARIFSRCCRSSGRMWTLTSLSCKHNCRPSSRDSVLYRRYRQGHSQG